MASEVEALCGQLVGAVEAMLNPLSATDVRQDALKFCENFKEQSPPAVGVQCGLVLSQRPALHVRHFGLRLMEDIIKLRWNDMTAEEKVFVKDNAMRLMASGTADILTEPLHIKDAVSRIVVEIAKREWPQHWPSFLTELEALCANGNSQTELVMFVLLRLVEDVAVLQTLEQNQRRKEIYQALNAQMTTVFAFLQALLERHYQGYQEKDRERHAKVCAAVLETYNSFVEWVPMNHIMANDHYLLKCLCHLLSDERLQLHAAECLLSIVSWKAGKIQDRAQLLVLFKTEMMAPLFGAAEAAERHKLQEQHYVFLKKMVQVLVELGVQLCAVWSAKECQIQRPPDNFDVYLNALLAFSRHPSITVNFYAHNLWGQLCRHADISQDDKFVAVVPKWIEIAAKKVVKSGFPSKSDVPACSYSRLDFETDEAFTSQFAKSRIILLEIFKTLSTTNPWMPYQYADNWLRSVLARPLDLGETKDGAATLVSPAVLELDAVQLLLDAILCKCSFQDDATSKLVRPATELLKICLDYRSSDPLIVSAVLSCISSLFVVATVTPEALMPILNQIFACITFGSNPGFPLDMSQEIKSLRRHGCSLLVKIGMRHPQTLVPLLDHLRSTIVDDLHAQRGALHKMEYVTLIEALVLVSNQVGSYEAQNAFLAAVTQPVCDQLKSLESGYASGQALMAHIGLGVAAGNQQVFKNRSDLAFCIQFLLAVSRRTSWPSDAETCRRGGFVDPFKSGWRCPGANVCLSVMRQILGLARSFSELWTCKLSPSQAKALDMLDIERSNVLGIHSRCSSEGPAEETEVKPEVQKSDLQRVQHFVFEQFENLYHLLSQYCVNFGHEFYRQPGLAEGIVSSVLQGMPHLPDYRLRAVIRTFVKSLINKCPASQFSAVLAPIFNLFCPYMLNRLTDRWDQVTKMREDPDFDPDAADSAEVVADVIACQLTREYLDVIKAILTSGGGSDLDTSKSVTTDTSDNKTSSTHNLTLSELGSLVIQHDSIGQTIVQTLLRALLWPDSPTSARASAALEAIMPQLAQSDQMGGADAAHIMFTVLSAIHKLGQHEANYIKLTQLAVLSYGLLRPKHATVAEVLSQVPGCHLEDVKKFDARVMLIFGDPTSTATVANRGGDKAIKAMFKKIICQFTGVDVAQRFKKEVVIKNLPTLQLLKQREKTPSLVETESKDIGLTSLFSPVKSEQNGFHANGSGAAKLTS